MRKLSIVIGFVVGALFLVSSAMHGVVGWKVMAGELAKASAPADLTSTLATGWTWGGVAMLAFAVIVLGTFLAVARGRAPSMLPVRVIGAAYLLFGAGALLHEPQGLFYLGLFAVPGALLLAASWGAERG